MELLLNDRAGQPEHSSRTTLDNLKMPQPGHSQYNFEPPEGGSTLAFIAFMSVVGLGLALLAYSYYAQKFSMNFFFNADALYLPTLFNDLAADPSAWQRWYLTPAPYFVPDMPLYLLAKAVVGNPYHATPLFFCFQLAIEALLLFGIFTVFFSRTTAALLAGSTFAVYAWLLSTGLSSLSYALVSAHHYGAFIGWTAGCMVLLRLPAATGRRFVALLGFLAGLVTLTTLSDRLFVVHFVLPALVAIGHLWGRGFLPLPKAAAAAATCLAASAAGVVLERLIIYNRTLYKPSFGIKNLEENAATFAVILKNFALSLPVAATAVLVFYGAGLAILIFHGRLVASGRFHLRPPLLLLVTLGIASMAASTLVVLLTQNVAVTDRYMIPMLTAPVLFLPLLLTIFGPAVHGRTAVRSAWVALASTVPALALAAPSRDDVRTAWYPDIAQCVDRLAAETGLRHGLAQYWHTKPILLFSREAVTVSQYINELEPMLWVNDSGRYASTYDFAVIEPGPTAISQSFLRVVAGEPSRTVPCGSASILVYGHDRLNVSPVSNVGDEIAWPACHLPGLTGRVEDGCVRSADPARDDATYLSFGPYVRLPVGHYRVEFDYSSPAGSAVEVGTWDAVAALPDRAAPLASGVLTGTHGKEVRTSGSFAIPKDFGGQRVEFRSLFADTAALTVRRVRLSKVTE